MKDITQAYISNVLPHFKEGFLNKWGLNDYTDPTQPSIFIGLYNQIDINTFLNHKSYRIVSLQGNDMHPHQLNILKQVVDFQTTFCWQAPGTPSDLVTEYQIPHKSIWVPMKDYSSFTPTPLGENIYVYKGIHGNRYDYFKWEEIVSPLREVFGQDRIIHSNHLPISELKENYYNDCFVYVKPNDLGGATTMFELAHMGRKTLGGGFPDLPYLSSYKDIYHLIELIQEEAEYMGHVREHIAKQVKETFVGTEWLSLDYWTI